MVAAQIVTLQAEICRLKSRVEGLKVNRDSILEENRRFRALLNTKGSERAELESKLESAEGSLNAAHERAERLAVQVEKTDTECVRVVFVCERTLKELKELRSEHEGKMDTAHEVITQLEAKIELQTAAKDLRIEIVQMSSKSYFWVLARKKEQLARSCKIAAENLIEKEADDIAAQLNLPVIVNKRK